MADLYMLTLANGDVLTQTVRGSHLAPLWTCLESVTRFKVHRPELLLYRPVRVDETKLNSRLRPLADQGYRFILPDLEPFSVDVRKGPVKSIDEIIEMLGSGATCCCRVSDFFI